MLKIMVVEDEVFVRRSLINAIESSSNDFKVVAEAANGKQALELFEKNDINVILTDIAMPVMDGLELIQNLRNLDSKLKIIILSCMDDFGFVRQAMRYGVDDYFLKVETDPEELIEKLKKLESQIHTEKEATENLNPDKDIISHNHYEVMEKLLRMLVLDQKTPQPEVIRNIIQLIPNLSRHNLTVVLLRFDSLHRLKEIPYEDDFELLDSSALSVLRNLLEPDGLGSVFKKDAGQIIALFHFPGVSSQAKVRSIILDKIGFFLKHMETSFSVTLTAGVSDMQNDCTKLSSSYEQAVKALKYRFFSGGNKVIFYTDLPKTINLPNTQQALNKEYILTALDGKSLFDLQSEIDKVMTEWRARSLPEKNIKNAVIEIIFLLSTKISEHNMETAGAFDTPLDILNIINDTSTYEELKEWFLQYIEAFYNYYLQLRSNIGTTNIVDKIKEYVEKNFSKNINLNVVANNFDINPCYASIVFKAKTGQNFIDYIASLRIEKAKNLLETAENSIQDIGRMVGYPNSQYFCKVFRKHTGMSPTEHRISKH